MKFLATSLLIVIILGFSLISLLYFGQERLIFFPSKLSKEHQFTFDLPFEEIEVSSGTEKLSSLLFTKSKSKGVLLYFHGNAGDLSGWGHVAQDFRPFPYDIWIIDYRGYGKSTGTIRSEKDLYQDAEALYQTATQRYNDKEIIIYGRSIGSGVGAYLAKKYPPKMLILETPYYNFPDLVTSIYPVLPTSIIRYTLCTNEYIAETSYPVHLFHGTQDELIPYDSAVRLERLSDNITLHTIEGAGHNNISDFPIFRERLLELLNAR